MPDKYPLHRNWLMAGWLACVLAGAAPSPAWAAMQEMPLAQEAKPPKVVAHRASSPVGLQAAFSKEQWESRQMEVRNKIEIRQQLRQVMGKEDSYRPIEWIMLDGPYKEMLEEEIIRRMLSWSADNRDAIIPDDQLYHVAQEVLNEYREDKQEEEAEASLLEEDFLESNLRKRQLIKKAWHSLWAEQPATWAKWTKIGAIYLAYPADLLLNIPALLERASGSNAEVEGYLQATILCLSTQESWVNSLAKVGLTVLGVGSAWTLLQSAYFTQAYTLVTKLAGQQPGEVGGRSLLLSLGLAGGLLWAGYKVYQGAKGSFPGDYLQPLVLAIFVVVLIYVVVRRYLRLHAYELWEEMGAPLRWTVIQWGVTGGLLALPVIGSWMAYGFFEGRGLPQPLAFILAVLFGGLGYKAVMLGIEEVGSPLETPEMEGSGRKKKQRRGAPLRLNEKVRAFFRGKGDWKIVLGVCLFLLALRGVHTKGRSWFRDPTDAELERTMQRVRNLRSTASDIDVAEVVDNPVALPEVLSEQISSDNEEVPDVGNAALEADSSQPSSDPATDSEMTGSEYPETDTTEDTKSYSPLQDEKVEETPSGLWWLWNAVDIFAV